MFGIYTITAPAGSLLTPSKAFVTLTLVNILNFPLTIIPAIISGLIQFKISLNRIENFLKLPDLNNDNIQLEDDVDELTSGLVQSTSQNFRQQKQMKSTRKALEESAVIIERGNFVWDDNDNTVFALTE